MLTLELSLGPEGQSREVDDIEGRNEGCLLYELGLFSIGGG